MTKITSETSMQEIAVLVSEALDNAGIPAVLSGGGAVSQYSDNEYMTTDLDFVSVASNKAIAPIVAELGFTPVGKDFRHPNSRFFVEFPARNSLQQSASLRGLSGVVVASPGTS